MDGLNTQKIEASHNLSNIFQISGKCLLNFYNGRGMSIEPETELVSIEALAKDAEKRKAIWSAYENTVNQLITSEPNIRPLIQDLMVYERAVWDTTFSEYDFKSYQMMREHKLVAFQKSVQSDNNYFLNNKFSINQEGGFNVFKTKWKWYSNDGKGELPNPGIPAGVFHYFIRPTLFRGTVMIKNLNGIDTLLLTLLNDYSEFDAQDIISLIRNGAAPDYHIPSKEEDLLEDIAAFLRKQIIVYDSISLIPTIQNTKVIENRKSVVL